MKITLPKINPAFLPARSESHPAKGRKRIAVKAKEPCAAPMKTAPPPRPLRKRGKVEKRLWKLKKKKKLATKASSNGQGYNNF